MKHIKQFILYLIVGGIAAVIEWFCFYFFNKGIHYFFATAFAFLLSTLANWFAGRMLLFKNTNLSLLKELVQIYTASIIGLFMNLTIMLFFVEKFGMQKMLSKIITTGIVFFWNFFARKRWIYK